MSDSNSTPKPARDAEGFGFADPGAKPSVQDVLKRPVTIVSIVLAIAVVVVVVWVQQRAVYVELDPPRVSYELLPNIGLTEGVPIAIKLNQIAVFRISDPLGGGGGALRAREVVANLEGAIEDLIEQPGRDITLDESGEYPAIVQFAADGTGRRVIVELTADDLTLAGTTEAKLLASIWAERLADSLKVLMFAEAPEFSVRGPEFRDALTLMYLGARGERGAMSNASLDESFEQLEADQRLALAELPPRPVPEDQGQGEVEDVEAP